MITNTSIPLQRLVSGDTLCIHTFACVGSKPGPSVYLHGNLHGPEILGGALLVRLIEFLSTQPDINGRLTIVPLANPIGVQSQEYGFQFGRWNAQNGKDWNRIFSKKIVLTGHGDSIEQKLASTLQTLANGHDTVLDIHTSGRRSIPHLYVASDSADYFAPLAGRCVLTVDEDDYLNAFDESCVASAVKEGRKTQAATWEAGTHGTIGATELEERFQNLLGFLSSCGVLPAASDFKPAAAVPTFPLKSVRTLYADSSCYIVWVTEPGTTLRAGDIFARAYDPSNGQSSDCFAPYDLFLITQYPLQAVSDGQELAKVVRM